MRRIRLSGILMLAGWMTAVFAIAQEHPPVSEGVSETAAKNLHDDLIQKKKILVIDVRTPKEYFTGHVPGAINVPIEELSKRIDKMKVSKDTTIVTVCEHGGRSSRAAVELHKLGYQTSSFCRLDEWKKKGYKIETRDPDPAPSSKVYRFYCHHSCLTYVETAELEQICEHCNCGRPYRECMKEN